MANPTLYPSPGIYINEFDRTLPPTSRFNVGQTTLVIGVFQKGPVSQLTPIRNIKDLIETFGLPDDRNRTSWYLAKNALDYGGTPLVWRVHGNNQRNANYGFLPAYSTQVVVNNQAVFYEQNTINTLKANLSSSGLGIVAKTPGTWANGLLVAVNIPTQILSITPATAVLEVDITRTNPSIPTAQETYIDGLLLGDEIQLLDDNNTPVTTSTLINKVKNGNTYYVYLNLSASIDTVDVDNDNAIKFHKTGHSLTNAVTVTVFSDVTNPTLAVGNTVYEGNTPTTVVALNPTPTSDIRVRHSLFRNNTSLRYTDSSNNNFYWLVSVEQEVRFVPGAYDIFGNPLRWESIRGTASTTYYGKHNNASADGISLAVIDGDGDLTGRAGTVLEVYSNLSTVDDAMNQYGVPINIIDRVNNQSRYINIVKSDTLNLYTNYTTLSTLINGVTLTNGADYYTSPSDLGLTLSNNFNYIKSIYNEVANQDTFNIDYIMPYINYAAFTSNTTFENEKYAYIDLVNYILEEVCEFTRKTICIFSPPPLDIIDNQFHVENSLDFRGQIYESSYGFLVHEWLYTYDQYNKKFFWNPSASEVVGVFIRNKELSNNYLSPAGYVRGVLLNTIKLSNPAGKSIRDRLYQSQINSIVPDAGNGFVLYGDKSLLTYESFFNRINVRKVVIEIYKECSEIAKPYLFGVNNAYTRSQLSTEVTRFLNRVVSQDGISEFRVICDETNNPQEVIDNNEMILDIEIRPTLSVNYITINITATRNVTQVNITENF